MLRLLYRKETLQFRHPFTTAKGTRTEHATLIVALGFGPGWGVGEAPAIDYYGVTIGHMEAVLLQHKAAIERYALQDPERFWHFLHHLLPGENFLTAALDIAGWDLFAQLRRKPLYSLLGAQPWQAPVTDYTIGIDTTEAMQAHAWERPWPVYKIKLGTPDDIDHLRAIREFTRSPFRVDANEGWTYEEARRLLPELKKLGVVMVEQPLAKTETEAQRALKAQSPLPLLADESCVGEGDVAKCADGFHGINIKLVKCGGITPARRMIAEARKRNLSVMLGCMSESSIGTAALAHLAPLADFLDADGPLLLAEDLATGLEMQHHRWKLTPAPGMGIRLTPGKIEVAR